MHSVPHNQGMPVHSVPHNHARCQSCGQHVRPARPCPGLSAHCVPRVRFWGQGNPALPGPRSSSSHDCAVRASYSSQPLSSHSFLLLPGLPRSKGGSLAPGQRGQDKLEKVLEAAPSQRSQVKLEERLESSRSSSMTARPRRTKKEAILKVSPSLFLRTRSLFMPGPRSGSMTARPGRTAPPIPANVRLHGGSMGGGSRAGLPRPVAAPPGVCV
eukprot:1146872-Pelagomonas_calceolata.AAC.5